MPANDRETRAVALFTCPTCKAPAGTPCRGNLGGMRPTHGPACHPLRRQLLATINRVGTESR